MGKNFHQESALSNLDRLWQMTEQVKQRSLSSAEEANVTRVRALIQLLRDDTLDQHNPPLTITETLVAKGQIETALKQAPFTDIENC